MITHPFRRIAAVAASLLTGLALVVGVPAAAMADTPADWATPPHVSGLQFLVVLFLIPLGLAIVISVLAALPTFIGDKGYQPGQSWRSEAEWFGGPGKGIEASDEAEPAALEGERGGTSARW